MLVSGGVDSSVCAALLHRALKPDQVIALHIDNGFMRENESEHVVENLREPGVPIKSERKKYSLNIRSVWPALSLLQR